MSCFFVSGIHTDIGKTVVSTILCKALGADYWKPVQAGSLDATDTDFVKKYNPSYQQFPSEYYLKTPSSPHFAAMQESLLISIDDFEIPKTQNTLLIEGAGGLLSPLGSSITNADFARHFNLPIILVIKHYLGSINHTLSILEYIKNNTINLFGVVYVGADTQQSELFLEKKYPYKILGRVEVVEQINESFIELAAEKFRNLV